MKNAFRFENRSTGKKILVSANNLGMALHTMTWTLELNIDEYKFVTIVK
jgi:hypothetical protein